MKLRAYIETTIPSYLTAWPSGNLIRAAEQRQTVLWWQKRHEYELVGSELLIKECTDGAPDAAEERLKSLEGIPLLDANDAVDRLANALMLEVPFPPKARADATHVALAAVHAVDLLVSWNIRHLINPVLRKKTESVCRKYGYDPPVICSPAELLGGLSDEGDVIAEVRATRDRLAERYGSIHELILALREMSKAAGRKTVSFPPRRPEGWFPDADAKKPAA